MLSMHEVLKNKLRSSSDASLANDCKRVKLEEFPTVSDGEQELSADKVVKKGRFELFSRRNIFALFYLICLIGCIYQMVEVLILYFQYETVTTLTIEKSTKVVPPSMSLCFPYITLIKLPLLFEKYPKFLPVAYSIMNRTGEKIDFSTHRIRNFKKVKGKFDWDFGEYIETHLNLKEILSVTVTLEEMFDQCVFLSPENYIPVDSKKLSDCRQIWDTDYYIKDENKCFLFAFKPIANRDYVYNLHKLANSYSYRNLLQQIRFDWMTALTDKMERAYIIFHPHDRLPRGRVDPVLTLRYPAKNVAYSISYSKIVSILLTHPYGSDCRNYSEIGYDSRGDCVDKCVIGKIYPVYRRVPYNMLFTKDSDLKIYGFKQLDGNQTMVSEFEQRVSECREVCKQSDCYNEYYNPSLLATEDGSKLKFIIEVPSALDINTELSPKLTLLEYIIYNTSVFGFWFGLCVLQLADFVEYIKKKRRDARKLRRMLKKRAVAMNLDSNRSSK